MTVFQGIRHYGILPAEDRETPAIFFSFDNAATTPGTKAGL
ncbi:hypothetical protein [Methanoregula sp.]|jgi:hypothetical protein